MRCLYCGKGLALLKRLTGSGEFCSESHRQKYQEEYNQLALDRLMKLADRALGDPAPRRTPPAVSHPVPTPVETPPSEPTLARAAEAAAAVAPAPEEAAPQPTSAAPKTSVAPNHEPAQKDRDRIDAPAALGPPIAQLPPPQDDPQIPAFRSDWDLSTSTEVAHPALSGNPAADWSPQEAVRVEVFPAGLAFDWDSHPRGAALEAREIFKLSPLFGPENLGGVIGGVQPETNPPKSESPRTDFTLKPRRPAKTPELWMESKHKLTLIETELGDLASLAFAIIGFEGMDRRAEIAVTEAVEAAVPDLDVPEFDISMEVGSIESAPIEAAEETRNEIAPPAAVPTAVVPVEIAPAEIAPVEIAAAEISAAEIPIPETAPQVPARTRSYRPVSLKISGTPDAKPRSVPPRPIEEHTPRTPPPQPATEPLPLTLHGIAPERGNAHMIEKPLTGSMVQLPHAEVLPLRAAMVFGPAPISMAASSTPAASGVANPADRGGATKPSESIAQLGTPAPSVEPPVKRSVRLKIGALSALLLLAGGGAYYALGSRQSGSTHAASGVVEGSRFTVAEAGWIANWSVDPPGAARGRVVNLLRGSAGMGDYRAEFRAQIGSKAAGWVFRAADPQNFYANKLEIVRPGPEPTLQLVRFAQVQGQERARVAIPVTLKARVDTEFRIKIEALGNHLTTWIQNQKVDEWTDSSIPTGGVGLFYERGESAALLSGIDLIPLSMKRPEK